jgi:hypothetical protein
MQYWVQQYVIDTYMCEKCKFILFIDSFSQLSFDRKGRTVCSVRLGRLDIGIVGSNPS